MKAKYNNDEEWAADRMLYLVGCELTNVYLDQEGFPGLEFTSDSENRRKWIVWIQRDPEGNGPGFLNIGAENEAAEEVMDEMKRDHEEARKAG